MRVKNKYIATILTASLLSSQYSNLSLYVNASTYYELNTELKTNLSLVEDDFNKYKLNGDLNILKKAMIEFGNLAKYVNNEEEIVDSLSNEAFLLFVNMREEIYTLAETTGSTQYVLDFAESIIEGWKSNRHMTVFSRIFFEEGIVEYNSARLPVINDALKRWEDYYYYLLLLEWEEPSDAPTKEWYDNMIDGIEETPEGDSYGPAPEYDSGVEPAPPTYEDMGVIPDLDEIWGDDTYSTDTYYQAENGKCMLVTRVFKENMVTETSKQEVPKNDYVYCGIYDYVFENAVEVPDKEVEIDEEYIETDQNIESNNYIYYTDKKKDLNPYYYNTGIRASLDGEVSYTQLRDVLYQIALKVKGFSTDSNEKSLTILEGRPIVLDSKKETYKKDEVENLLDSFSSLDIKIQEYKDESTTLNTSLQEYIEKNKSVELLVDDNKVSLSNVKVENSIVTASLNEIAEILKLNIEEKSGTYRVKGKSNYITFALDTKEYKAKDNQYKQFLVEAKGSGPDVYIDLKTLCEEMGYKINWDGDSCVFVLENKNIAN